MLVCALFSLGLLHEKGEDPSLDQQVPTAQLNYIFVAKYGQVKERFSRSRIVQYEEQMSAFDVNIQAHVQCKIQHCIRVGTGHPLEFVQYNISEPSSRSF